MALKRKSEPPPDRSSDNSLKLERASGSAKRRSEPPPSKLSSKYDLLNGDYLGPPLAMTSPQASLGKFIVI